MHKLRGVPPSKGVDSLSMIAVQTVTTSAVNTTSVTTTQGLKFTSFLNCNVFIHGMVFRVKD